MSAERNSSLLPMSERQPKGTAAAIIIILKQNPEMNPKQLADILNISLRRVHQVTQEFRSHLRKQ